MIEGSLFTLEFLLEGIRETEVWRALDATRVSRLRHDAKSMLEGLAARRNPNEAQTEEDLVYPLLECLGWQHRDVQPTASVKLRNDVPDALLFSNADEKAKAGQLHPSQRFLHGLCIVEAKRWQRTLDREDNGRKDEIGTPSSQMLRYLRRVDDLTKGKLRWGILTNGRIWRLYRHQGGGTAEKFLEIDLGLALQVPGCEPGLFDQPERGFLNADAWRDHVLRLFIVLFAREAFLPAKAGETFHDLALREGQFWETRVAKSLSETVFTIVFPTLSDAIAKADPKRPVPMPTYYLDEVRHGTLILLYRLLFVLYAEDRNLLPDESGSYSEVCLTRMRLEIADRKQRGIKPSASFVTYWPKLTSIFRAIGVGDDELGIPPYNGGLFDPGAAQILDRIQLPDTVLADIIFGLSHDAADESRSPKYINYRDLSVQQLGSVYERLLEYQLVAEDSNVAIALNAFGRKSSGSYYTPDELVQLIIARTIGPLVDETEVIFKEKVQAHVDPSALTPFDPAEAILRLKICDPAMGSGHFLVSLVDWMTDRVLEAMAAAELLAPGYVSPVVERIQLIRSRIQSEAEFHRWPITLSQLDNRHVVRRMVLKRCVYGVDLNPMAVELAKVALWLHSFTIGAPLSFLDHHLVCGNALFGERVRPVMDWAYGGNLLINQMVQKARGSARGMAMVEELTDADITEAKSSKSLFDEVQAVTKDLRAFMDLVHGVRWSGGGNKVRTRAINRLQRGDFGDPAGLLKGEIAPPKISNAQQKLLDGAEDKHKLSLTDKKAIADAEERCAIPNILDEVRAAIGRERFLHWEVAFPGVWTDWDSTEPKGGFDAVIGNPPWDRMKFQEVEWFSDRRPEIAMATRAADRKRLVKELLESKDSIVADYYAAVARADGSARVARECGVYPLLSGGDVNLYALFVERALALVKPDGIIGLLTPSGIASDKSASEFFKSVSITGRLGSLIDFENRRGSLEPFFPDVDSRFKFCVIVVAGIKRRFAQTTCGFFFQDVETLSDPARSFTLTPADFAKVNPNTGTAPIFRTRRDADITTEIYDRLPVLIDRRKTEPAAVYPVRYSTMFHMTNDSHLFVTKAELERSAYPVGGGRWRRGAEEFVPLYVGRTIKQFDHRAASVLVNDDNLHNAASSGDTTPEQHADPNFSPTTQYWVSSGAINWPGDLSAVIAFRDIARPTDVRTMIAAFVPFCGSGNKLPLLIPALPDNGKAAKAKVIAEYQESAPLLLGNMNSMVFDFVARQKVHAANLNWFIVEQLPVVPATAYARRFGSMMAGDIVRNEVLALTYNAHDMAPFARDLGYIDPATGKVRPPFPWDRMDRQRRRAKLDALYFMLYFPSATHAEIATLKETVSYIYSTFPILEREQIASHGRYLSRDLCLLSINALAAGDPNVSILLQSA
jgi:hypothetical protein